MKFLNENILEGTSGESSIEAAIDTLPNLTSATSLASLPGLTSFGAAGATTNIVAGDVTIYNAVNDGNPTFSIGSSATNRLEISTPYNSGVQTLCDVDFKTYTASGTANDGRFSFYVDEVVTLALVDSQVSAYGNVVAIGGGFTAQNTTTSSATEGGKLLLRADDGAAMADNHRLGVIEFEGAEDASNTRSIGARIQAIARDTWDGSNNDADLEFYTTDGTTESKVLTLDADKLATFTGAVTVTGALSGTLATVSQTNITGVGAITTGTWRGSVIASSYLDADTAHLSGTQSFTGTKTFDETISGAIDGNAATATTLATTRAINGVNFNGSAAITIPTSRIWGAYIKLLPIDFMPNDDGGTSKGITLNDSGTTGMKPGVAAMELVAMADIPEGFTATHVDIYDNSHDLVIKVYEMNIGASGMTLKGTGAANTTLDMTDVESTVTNFLAIRVETTATSERVFGGRITIAPN